MDVAYRGAQTGKAKHQRATTWLRRPPRTGGLPCGVADSVTAMGHSRAAARTAFLWQDAESFGEVA